MRQLRFEVLAVTCGIAYAMSGCDTRTTSVRVADPGKVSISSGSAIVLPSADAASSDQRGTLREDSFEPEPGARAHYRVDAVRQNGEVALEWSTKVPILNGEHQTLIDKSGSFNDSDGVVWLFSPGTLQASDFRIDSCAHLGPVSAKGASVVGYRVTEWNTCRAYSPYGSASLDVPFTLQTPWTNVVEIRDHTEVSIGGNIAIGIFGLGMTGGGVALMAVPKNCVGCVIGGAFIALLGVLTGTASVLDIAEGSHDDISYPPKKSPE
jgi:hypothetical protein